MIAAGCGILNGGEIHSCSLQPDPSIAERRSPAFSARLAFCLQFRESGSSALLMTSFLAADMIW
jgi:hypothetical protein